MLKCEEFKDIYNFNDFLKKNPIKIISINTFTDNYDDRDNMHIIIVYDDDIEETNSNNFNITIKQFNTLLNKVEFLEREIERLEEQIDTNYIRCQHGYNSCDE